MKRFCTICKSEIELKRIMRGSPFCGTECRRKHRIELRRLQASRYCRLCHRPPSRTGKGNRARAPGAQEPANDTLQANLGPELSQLGEQNLDKSAHDGLTSTGYRQR